MKKLILTFVLVILLVGGGITLGVIKSNEAKTATSTVEMDLNPSASFVVNKNNVVLSVVFTNEDADLIFSDIEVVGRSMEEVAKDFTQRSIEVGTNVQGNAIINLNADASTGAAQNCITFTITGDAKQAEALQTALVNKVNAVFDENGIFGRAVADIKAATTNLAQKYEGLAEKFAIDAAEFEGKTEAEILAMINEKGKQLEGLTSQSIEDLEAFINSSVIQNIEDAIDALEEQIETAEAQIDTLLDTYGDYIPEIIKQQIATAKNTINEHKADIKAKQAEIKQKIETKINELKVAAKTQFETLKTEFDAKVAAYKATYDAYKAEFDAKSAEAKEQTKEAIQAWRDAFNTAE